MKEISPSQRAAILVKESGTKTEGSELAIKLHPSFVNVLKAIKPLHVTKETPVFLNQDCEPINFHTWRAKIWYAC